MIAGIYIFLVVVIVCVLLQRITNKYHTALERLKNNPTSIDAYNDALTRGREYMQTKRDEHISRMLVLTPDVERSEITAEATRLYGDHIIHADIARAIGKTFP